MRFQKPTLQRSFWKAFVFISTFDRFSVDATGENASKIILFNTNAGNCCRSLGQWAYDSSRPDDANVAPQRNLQAHSPALTCLYLRYWCWIKMAASISCCCWWRLVCQQKEREHKLTANKHKDRLEKTTRTRGYLWPCNFCQYSG